MLDPPEAGHIDAPAEPVSVEAEKIGNVVQHQSIANQTINLGARVEWIQSMRISELRIAERRLLAVAGKHETRAVLPVGVPLVLTMMLLGAASEYSRNHGIKVGATELGGLLGLALAWLVLPVWLTFYDSRRRNRRIVEVAERRLAEVVVELALRRDARYRRRPRRRVRALWRSSALRRWLGRKRR